MWSVESALLQSLGMLQGAQQACNAAADPHTLTTVSAFAAAFLASGVAWRRRQQALEQASTAGVVMTSGGRKAKRPMSANPCALCGGQGEHQEPDLQGSLCPIAERASVCRSVRMPHHAPCCPTGLAGAEWTGLMAAPCCSTLASCQPCDCCFCHAGRIDCPDCQATGRAEQQDSPLLPKGAPFPRTCMRCIGRTRCPCPA